MRTARWKYIRNLHPEYRFSSHIDRANGEASLEYIRSWEVAAKTDPKAAAMISRYRQRPAEELYDLDNDPFELNNVASTTENAKQLQKMREELDAWMKSTGDQPKIDVKPLLLTEPFTLLPR